MVFSTILFLFAFLPLFLGVYYLLPFRVRSLWILVASALFYGWWRIDFLALIGATTVWTYLLGAQVVDRGQQGNRSPSRGRWALATGVVLNLGTLFYFKYFNFGADSLNALIQSMGGKGVTAWEVVLPVGISFYVFQATSYLIDIYRGDARPARDYVDLAAYIVLFPQLVAGPIVRYHDIATQLHNREHSFERFSRGAVRFMEGFCRKVLVADTVAVIADAAFGLAAPTAGDAWLGTIAYAIQIYFDFSGYSAMAIGLGLMIGFEFRENFDAPYTASSITEFWRRWHISLSTWLRDYLYVPLGGSRRGPVRTYVNLLTVMVLGGLWHGAAWTFVVWGLWHGLWLILERLISVRWGVRSRETGQIMMVAVRIYTLLVVLVSWVFFRAPSMAVAAEFLRAMAGVNGWGLSGAMGWQVGTLATVALFAGAGVTVAERLLRASKRLFPLLSYFLFLVAVVKLAAESYSPFLYFQF